MSDSDLEKMLAAASTGMAMSDAAKAKREREALAAIEDKELSSMGGVIAKQKQFQQAAKDMVTRLTECTSSNLTKDLPEIIVRKDWSLFKSPVPADMKIKVCAEAQDILNKEIHALLSVLSKDAQYVATQGLRDYDHDEKAFVLYFEPGRGGEFIEGLDETEVAAIAQTGILNIVENHLSEIITHNKTTPAEVIGARPKNMTSQYYRALEEAFVHAAEKAVAICTEMKKEPEAIVKANLPFTP